MQTSKKMIEEGLTWFVGVLYVSLAHGHVLRVIEIEFLLQIVSDGEVGGWNTKVASIAGSYGWLVTILSTTLGVKANFSDKRVLVLLTLLLVDSS